MLFQYVMTQAISLSHIAFITNDSNQNHLSVAARFIMVPPAARVSTLYSLRFAHVKLFM